MVVVRIGVSDEGPEGIKPSQVARVLIAETRPRCAIGRTEPANRGQADGPPLVDTTRGAPSRTRRAGDLWSHGQRPWDASTSG